MVIEAEIEDLFVEEEDGSISVSESAPSVLTNAIRSAQNNLQRNDEYILRSVGEPRRALDFGIKDLTPIQTNSATIFAGKHPDLGPKVLAVGVSKDGHLSENQVQEVLESLSAEADLLPEEMAKSMDTSRALRSIKQAKYILIHNANSMIDEIYTLRKILNKSSFDEDELTSQLNVVEAEFHNLLSSVYTFSETVDQSLKDIEVIRTSKHHIQKYKDEVSIAIGLRHYIQHRSTFSLQWMATYNHKRSQFEYDIGILASEVCNSEYYHGTESDAAGNKYEPLEYYYGDISDFLINIEDVSDTITEATEAIYNDLKTDLRQIYIEGVEITNQFHRIKEVDIKGVLNEQN